jgi:ribosome-associated protein
MIRITDSIALPDDAITERFVRAMGSRGQNLNKAATGVELRFDVRTSPLPRDMQARLVALGGRRVTKAGVLTVTSRASRLQAENRDTARARLIALLKRAAQPAKIRRPTRLPASFGEDRLDRKHRQGATKRSRKRLRANVA